MTIKKIGHCCLLIKEKALTILTDPGSFTVEQNEILGINLILITHEHGDHFHVDSLKQILKNNPQAQVITNQSVGTLLDKENIKYKVVSHGQDIQIDGVYIEGFGKTHADIYKTIPPVENTGYFINKKFFYPGDAFYNPERPVEILAVPISGPWMKLAEAIDYVLALKPKIVFPVHDGLLSEKGRGVFYRLPQRIISEAGMDFKILEEGKEVEL